MRLVRIIPSQSEETVLLCFDEPYSLNGGIKALEWLVTYERLVEVMDSMLWPHQTIMKRRRLKAAAHTATRPGEK